MGCAGCWGGAGREGSVGLEMADAACPVSLCAHRYNACLPHRVMLSLGKHHFGAGGGGYDYPVQGAGMEHCNGVGRSRGQWGGNPTPPGVLLSFVPALRQLPEFAGEKCGSAGLGAGSFGAGQSCTWLSHAGSSPGVLLGEPAQFWLVGEAASPALCRAVARHGNGI